MVKRRQILAAATASAASALAGCNVLGGDRDVVNQYTYELNVEPATTVSNATLYAPLPVRDGEAALPDLVDGTVAQLPDDWTTGRADTDRGPMLELVAPTLDPDGGPYYAMETVDATDEIDTREALATEPVLEPRSNDQQVECDFPHPDSWDDRLRCYTYESDLYGTYDGGASTLISAGLWGENGWWNGGWSGNEYLDRVSGTVTGDGWTTATGGFREGVGSY